MVLPFLLAEKANTGGVDYSSSVASYDILASTVQMHLLKQHLSSRGIVSKVKALLISYKFIPPRAC
jgi:hypothetical protein